MSPDPQPPASGPPAPWPVLSVNERRVLGVLVEKAKTTPDAYPLSLNALVTGCNQKSNRDPLLDLTDQDVEEALLAAQKKGLTTRITGGRVERWRHNLYDAWGADKVELAVLGELLLRGPQTEGELRGRASRMEPIADLESLRTVLKPLSQRQLVVYLTPEGRRGTVVTHGFHDSEEIRNLRSTHHAEEAVPAASSPPMRDRPTPGPAPSDVEARLTAAVAELAQLRRIVIDLQGAVTDLAGQFRNLKASLGG